MGIEAATAEGALRVVVYIHAFSVLLPTLEYVSLSREFGPRGAFSWRVLQASGTGDPRGMRTRLQVAMFTQRGTLIILSTQVTAVLVFVLFPMGSWIQWSALVVSAVTLLVFTARQRYGQDGADQMNVVVGVTLALVVGPFQSDEMMRFGLWFLALQAVLAYSSAGVAKLLSPIWRRGLAVGLVVDTATFGSRLAGDFLKRHGWVSRLLSWGTIAFELTFPLAIVSPWPVTVSLLIGGLVFHVGIALVMGLNNFVPAFISVYPAVLFASAASPWRWGVM